MADDKKAKLDLDADKYVLALSNAIAALKEYGSMLARVSQQTAKATDDGVAQTRVLKEVDAQGKQLLITQQKISGEWETYSVRAKAATAATEKLAQAQSRFPKGVDTTGLARDYITRRKSVDAGSRGATADEAYKVAQATARVNALITAQKVQVNEISTLWKEVARGDIRQYDDRMTKVQGAVRDLVKAQKALGVETRNTSIEQKKQRASADAALKAQTAAAKEAVLNQIKLGKEKQKQIELDRKIALAQRAISTRFTAGQASSDYKIATDKERAVFAARANALDAFVKKNKISVSDLNRVWKNVDTGKLKQYGGALDGLQNQIVAFNTAGKALGSAVRRQEAALEKAKNAAKGLLISWRSFARLVAVQAVHRLIALVARGLVESAKEAVKLGNAIAEIQTISQNNTQATKEWFDQAQRLSSVFGTDVATQLEAAYQTLSNQIAEGAEVTRFLVDANRLATAAVSSTSDAVNILSSVINAYGDSALNADEISAKLFKGVELGRFRLSQIANSFGDVAVVAQQTGVRFEELVAAMATLTRQGIQPTKAMTQLRGILIKVLKPTEKMKEFITGLGYESGQAAIQSEGLIGFLRLISEATGGNATEIAQLINRVRGLSGALALTGEGLKEFEKDLKEVENATSSYNRALDITLNSSAKRAEQSLESLKNKFRDFGQSAINGFALTLDAFFNFSDKIQAEQERLAAPAEAARRVQRESKVIIQALEEQLQAHRRLTAARIRGANAAFAITSKTYSDLAEQAKTNTKVVIKSLTANVSELKQAITKATSDIAKNRKASSDALQAERDITFAWAQEARDELGKIQALNERIAVLNAERLAAAKKGNLESVDVISKQIIGYVKEIQKLQSSADKGNASNAEKRREIEKKIVELQLKARERIIAANKEALKRAQQTGQQPRLQGFQITAAEQRTLRDLVNEWRKIKDINTELIDARGKLAEATKKELQARKVADAELQKTLKKNKEDLIIQELRLQQFKDINTAVNKFDLKKTLAGDPREAAQGLEAQVDNLKKMEILINNLGLGDREREVLQGKTVKSLLDQLGISAQFLQKTTAIKDTNKLIAVETNKQIDATTKLAEKRGQDKKDLVELIQLTQDFGDFYNQVIRSPGASPIAVGGQLPALTDLFTAIKKTDPKAIFKSLGEVTRITDTGDTEKVFNTVLRIIELSRKRNKHLDAEKEINKELEEGKEIIESSKTKVIEWTSQTEILKQSQEGYNKTLEATEVILDRVRAKAKSAGTSGSGDLETNARGRVMLGNDSILGLRRPDEAVMNATSTRRFYSQLVAMNATPQSLRTPGTSIGNVNVTMQATGRLGYDAVALGRQIKKLSARKVI